jgi:pilus assembly protein Flp/PilA
MALSLTLRNMIGKFLKEEDAVTAIEYALMASLIAIAIIAAVKLIATNLNLTFATISTAL